ncbi:MAG: hypothetical protein OQJ89_05965, partial [Kangiellaceae bacterium]|nr:hypothetical protein [Kangiellaceae bacterium]
MSGLKIGLVTSVNDESEQLTELLQNNRAEIVYNISPSEITDKHVEESDLHVWLLNVDDDSWHDAVDHLLDESEVPVYFSEPGTLAKQSHPEFWCSNLLDRLYEITGLTKDEVESHNETTPDDETSEVSHVASSGSSATQPAPSKSVDSAPTITPGTAASDVRELEAELDASIEALELSTVDLPSDIAAELVSELEDISPVLSEELTSSNEKPSTAVNEPVLASDETTLNETELSETVSGETITDETVTDETSPNTISTAGLEEPVERQDEEIEIEVASFDVAAEAEESAELNESIEEQEVESEEIELADFGDFQLEDDEESLQVEAPGKDSESAVEESIELLDLSIDESPIDEVVNEDAAKDEVANEDDAEDFSGGELQTELVLDLLDDESLASEVVAENLESSGLSLDGEAASDSLELQLDDVDAEEEIKFEAPEEEQSLTTDVDENSLADSGGLSSDLELVSIDGEDKPITGRAVYQIDEGELPEEEQ